MLNLHDCEEKKPCKPSDSVTDMYCNVLCLKVQQMSAAAGGVGEGSDVFGPLPATMGNVPSQPR